MSVVLAAVDVKCTRAPAPGEAAFIAASHKLPQAQTHSKSKQSSRMEVRSELGGKSEYQTDQSHLHSELKQKIEEAKEFLNIEEHEVKDLDSKWESDISE